MKILSLEGRNITSLEEFKVDFAEGPLANRGIFAITGPTGSGKSTLLDAICLALYNDTPRLREDTKVWVGREGEELLNSNDVRGLLRRGTGSGWVRVRFLGRDQRVYQSEWSVRRARDRADGALQTQTMKLVDEATGATLGAGRLRETLELIAEKVGLTFDQFRRTVLLAQGDFAAFLKEPAKTRAELLEKLTGQDIYAKVSRLAFQRAKQARLNLEAEQKAFEQLQGQVLDPTARATLAENLAEAESRLVQLDQELDAAKTTLAWYALAQQLGKERDEAENAEKAAQQVVLEAAPLRAELTAVEGAEDCRVPLERMQDASRRQQESSIKGKLAVSAVKQAEQARDNAEETLRRQEEILQRVEAQGQALAIEVQRARALDTEVGAAQRQHQEARVHLDRLQGEARELERSLSGLQAAERKTAATIQVEANFHEENHAWERRHNEWPLLQVQLQQLLTAQQEHQKLSQGLPSLSLSAQKAAEGLTAATSTEKDVFSGLEDLKARVTSAEAACPPLAPLLEQQERLRKQKEQLDRQQQLLQRGEDLKAQEEAERLQLAEAEAESRTAAQEAQDAEVSRTEALKQLAASRKAHEATIEVRSLVNHRAVLRPGEPCQLCGSVEHPWAGTPLEALIHDTETQVKEAENRLRELDRIIADRRAVAAQCQKAADTSAQKIRVSEPIRKQLREELQGLLSMYRSSGVELPPGENLAKRIESALETVQQQRQLLDIQLRDAQTAEQHLKKLQKEASEMANRQEKLRGETEVARRQAEDTDRAWKDGQKKLQETEERRAGLLLALPADLQDQAGNLAVLRTFLEKGIAAWTDHLRRQKEAEAEQQRLRVQLEERRQQQMSQAENLRLAEEQEGRARQTESALRQQRAEVLGGQSADEVEKRALREQKEAMEARNRARDAQVKAQAELQGAEKKVQETAAEEANSGQTLAEAVQQLEKVLGGRKLEEIARVLSRDTAWVTRTRAELRNLEDLAARANERLQERQRRYDDHRKEPPTVTEEAATALLSTGQATRKGAQDQVISLQQLLQQDKERRNQLEERRVPLEAAEQQHKRWGCLQDLIGSEDGAKFRSFAQGLTLELLIQFANNNLRNFSDRYRLQRAPNNSTETRGDMNLQVVDRSMGDEIRPISSLSGGELFLVSLALALGLASLASHRNTRVETVFIDEGFGSLDARTLDVALSALEALQAEGRQVGIVSHVAGLTERVGIQVRVKKDGIRSRVELTGR